MSGPDLSRRASVFTLALVPRLLVGWVTLGSVDLTYCFRNSTWMLSGMTPPELPYLPGLEAVLRIGTMLLYFTSLPAGFCYKLFPLLFDSATAVLLGERSKKAGILYALAPLPILINAMHMQWEGMVLCFLVLALLLAEDDRPAARALAGASLVLSIIVKPVALPLVPLFFDSPDRLLRSAESCRRALYFLAGGAATALIYVPAVTMAGFPVTMDRLWMIFAHAGYGGTFFGVPRLPLLGRLWGLLPALAVIAFYWRGRLTRPMAALAVFAAILGLSPLVPQYLAWLIPLAFLAGAWRFAAVYTLASGAFVTLLYHTVTVRGVANTVFAASYGLLRPLGWLSPPATPPAVEPLLSLLGNAILPLLCVGMVLLLIYRESPGRAGAGAEGVNLTALLAPVSALLLLAAVLYAWASTRPEVTPNAFVGEVHRRVAAYDVLQVRPTRPDGEIYWIPRRLAGPPRLEAVNLSSILLVWLTVVSAAAWPRRVAPEAGDPISTVSHR